MGERGEEGGREGSREGALDFLMKYYASPLYP
jgi:hypothetical protein